VRWRIALSMTLLASIVGGCGSEVCDECPDLTQTLLITIHGLVGSRLTVENNGSTPITIGPGVNGALVDVFGPLALGSSYSVTIQTQPTTPSQTCSVANGSGTIGHGLSKVSITCTTNPGRFLYAASEGAGIVGFAIDSNGGTLTGLPPLVQAGCPTVFAVDPGGTFAFVGCHNGQLHSFVSSLSIDRSSGALTVADAGETVGFGPNSLTVDPSGRFLYVTTKYFGFFGYRVTPGTGVLSEFPVPEAMGAPITIEPEGRFAYEILQSEIVEFAFDSATGELTDIGTAPAPYSDASISTLVADPSASFLYGADLLRSYIVSYALDRDSGRLRPAPGSPFPVAESPDALTVDPNGRFLFVTNSANNSLSVYEIEQRTGALEQVDGSPFQTGQGPGRAAVDPTGRFLYVPSLSSGDIWAYAVDGRNGKLTPIEGSPFAALYGIHSIAISN
jgi:6-phosphogluconolactonase